MFQKVHYKGIFALLLMVTLVFGIIAGTTVNKKNAVASAYNPNNQRAQILQDQEAIRQVRYQFAEGLDTSNWALWESLFTPVVDIDFSSTGGPKESISREELVKLFQHVLSRPGLQGQNIYSNFIINVHGNTATSQSYLLANLHIQGFPGGEEFTLHGGYHDELVRTADGWKIKSMSQFVFFFTGNPNLLLSWPQ